MTRPVGVSAAFSRERPSRKSPSSVRNELTSIQTLLDKAGPRGKRNRDAAGILAEPPYLKPPREVHKLPQIVPPEYLRQVYDATASMDCPWILPSVKPPAWWKALLVTAFNTQLRRRSLFELRMDEIDWSNRRLRLPPERLKMGRPMIIPLNQTTLDHLQEIRGDRELVFPWPWNPRQFYVYLHKLLDMAGIPRKEHFALHALRRTAATQLAEENPETARLALGHTALGTTIDHYITPTKIMCEAINGLAQPWAEPVGPAAD